MRAAARIAATFLCLAAASAHAATVSVVQGEVMVNRGNGFQTVYGQTQVQPGDTIVVGVTGAAEITYGEGCVVSVPVGAVVTVKAQPPCGPLVTGAVGDPPPATLGLSPLAIGAIALGGVGLAAVLISNNNNSKDKSASP